MRTGLSIGFAARAAEAASDLVMLEQEEDGAYAGRLTVLGMVRRLDHAVYSGTAAAPSVLDCGRDGGGNLNTAVLVWPLRDDVRYRLYCTIGTLGPGEAGEVEERELVSFALTTTASLKHPARRVLRAEWLTGPWTTGGRRIAPPPLTVDGRELRTTIPVYGSVRVTTLSRRYRHPLRITWAEARPKLAADDWSEWAVCLPPPGRPVALALTAHRGARDEARGQGACGMGSFRVRDAEGEWPPECEPEDRYMDCDYCSGDCIDA